MQHPKNQTLHCIHSELLQRRDGYLTTLPVPKSVSREMIVADDPEMIWKETVVA
jgi:hypothetical protein